MSFTPGELVEKIRVHLPDFKVTYEPDFRQEIAESWNESIDDSAARTDWDWNPKFNLETMTADMIAHLNQKYKKG